MFRNDLKEITVNYFSYSDSKLPFYIQIFKLVIFLRKPHKIFHGIFTSLFDVYQLMGSKSIGTSLSLENT